MLGAGLPRKLPRVDIASSPLWKAVNVGGALNGAASPLTRARCCSDGNKDCSCDINLTGVVAASEGGAEAGVIQLTSDWPDVEACEFAEVSPVEDDQMDELLADAFVTSLA